MYEAYTDGSYQSSINAGGWASIILNDGKIIKKLYKGLKNTSNNRMEILSVLETLRWFKEPVDITIYSDSQYVVNTINQGWAKRWFQYKDYEKKNLDLWFEILDLLEKHNVTLVWVKGHEDNEMNNLADLCAVHAARCLNIPEDEYNTTQVYQGGPEMVSELESW